MFSLNNTDLYNILSVESSASDQEIKTAYRKKAMLYHPDKNNNSEESSSKFKDLTHAYSILGDPSKKKKYDLFGNDSDNFEEFSNFSNTFTMFNSFFDSGINDIIFNSTNIINDKIIEITCPLNLEEVYKCRKKKIEYYRKIGCTNCNFTGSINQNGFKICNECNGSGMVSLLKQSSPSILDTIKTDCKKCNKTGKILLDKYKCKICKGDGIHKVKDILNFEIRPGTRDKDIISLNGKGNFDICTNSYSDVKLTVHINDHQSYKIINNNLIIKKKILLVDALCTNQFNFVHINKKNYSIETNEIINPNTVIKINNFGMPISDCKKGDLYIIFDIIFPKKIKKDRKKFIEKLLPVKNNQEKEKEKDKNYIKLSSECVNDKVLFNKLDNTFI